MADAELMQMFIGDSIEEYDDFLRAKNLMVQMVELQELQDFAE